MIVALPCLAGAACSPATLTDGVTFSKPSSFLATPDWMRDAPAPDSALWRPISPQDFVGSDGRCAGTGVEPVSPDAASAPAGNPLPATAAGIGLGMSECEVIRRAGQADNFDIGANERGERALTLTYVRGNRPGIYRFTSGRLTSIERGPEPPPAPKVAKPKPKPAAPRTAAAPARPQPAPSQGSSAPWPAAQPAGQPAPAASPWPAPQQQSAPRPASPWPAPQQAPQQQPNSPWPAPGR